MYGIMRKEKIVSRKFKLWKDPYDCGYGLWKRGTIEIKNGVTVLVGCNGIGKTTLLNNIESSLKKDKIPVIHFDNLSDGGSNARSEKAFMEDFSFLAESMCSSEGENIVLNLYDLAGKLGNFVNTGIDRRKYNPFTEIFKNGSEDNDEKLSNERWILFDAVDSGLSIDNIVDLKEGLFKTIVKYEQDKKIYIIVSANEYEMANGEQCFDVYNGKYITFKDYEDYRSMILESKKWKEERTKVRKD